METLGASIIKTLAFFDLFDIPMTGAEVYSHAYQTQPTLAQTLSELDGLVAAGKIARTESFYHLPDREPSMVSDYKLRQARSFEMIRDARPWLSMFSAWPGVKGLAICNSLSFLNAHSNSDVDVFVLAAPNQLWTTRFVLVSLLALLGKRPAPGNESGKICLSFFLNADQLNLSDMALGRDDIYLMYWAKLLMTDQSGAGYWRKFYTANRDLVHPVSRQQPDNRYAGMRLHKTRFWKGIFAIAHPMLTRFRAKITSWQQHRFPEDITSQAGKGSGVIISDDVLKFHTQDRREEYRQAWIKRYTPFINA